MSDVKPKYPTSPTEIAFTSLGNLLNNYLAESAPIDNSVNLFSDAFVSGTLVVDEGASATGYVEVYVSASNDGGTTWGGDCNDADGPFTGTEANLPVYLHRIALESAKQTYEFFISTGIAAAFGNRMPKRWKLIFKNVTGATLPNPSTSVVAYLGINDQITA